MKKFAFALAVLLLVSQGAFAALRVATASTYPPYEFINEKGQLDGFDNGFSKTVKCFQLNVMPVGFGEAGNCNLKLVFAKMIIGAIELELCGCQ